MHLVRVITMTMIAAGHMTTVMSQNTAMITITAISMITVMTRATDTSIHIIIPTVTSLILKRLSTRALSPCLSWTSP